MTLSDDDRITIALLRDALESMVWQFAHRGVIDGKRTLSTGGLSALEEAFEALGWSDPHAPLEGAKLGCAADGCEEWANAGTPTADGGYKRFCSWHFLSRARGTAQA